MGFVCSALLEAQDIFGLDFDFDEFDKYGQDGYSDEEDEYEEEVDGEMRSKGKRKSNKKTIYEVGVSDGPLLAFQFLHGQFYLSFKVTEDTLYRIQSNILKEITVPLRCWTQHMEAIQ